jgi:hypothetical protein
MDMKMKNKNHLGLLLFILLACLAGLRIFFVARSTEFVDFRAYYDMTWAMLRGENPFIIANLRVWNWAEAPIFYPGAAPIFLPLMGFGIDTAKYIFLAVNIIAGIVLMLIVLGRFGLWENTGTQAQKIRSGEILPLILILLFLGSTPFIACLRHGQICTVASIILCTVLFYSDKVRGGILLGLTAMMKYSMITVSAPVILIRRNGLPVCVIGFSIFLIAGLFPLISGGNLTETYMSYYNEMNRQMVHGFNTYAESGYNMLHADLIAIPPLRTALKISVLVATFIVIIRTRHKELGIPEMLLIASSTMIISYHRLYDLVLVLPFLLAGIPYYWKKGGFSASVIMMVLVTALMIPENTVYGLSSAIGGIYPNNGIFCLSRFRNFQHILPLYPFVTLAIFICALLLCFRRPWDACVAAAGTNESTNGKDSHEKK